MRFLAWIFFIYAFWQLFKLVFRFALRYWIKKNAGKTFQWSSSYGYGGPQAGRPEGDIRVEPNGGQTDARRSRSTDTRNLGEYVDFEEVK